ncbi:amidohydrolase [Pendulispora albinea]|uniref:Amidohydrolase n=1 Tax=Pendulispora albinea TaxID=2741071 RepID=A0ABZ2MBM0_9BACT
MLASGCEGQTAPTGTPTETIATRPASLDPHPAGGGAACTLYHHGRIFTGDPRQPWANALGVCGEWIVFAGSDHGADDGARGSWFERVDLEGRTVVPGIHDAHTHVLGIPGKRLNDTSFVPGPGPRLDAVLALVRDGVRANPPGTLLVVMIGDAILADPTATRAALDPASPDHPVILRSWTGHGTVINTAAMRMLGIDETEPDPFGGRYLRAPGTQVITGVVQEYAEHGLNRRLFDRMRDDELLTVYRTYAERAVQLGYTSIQDIPLGLTHARTASVLRAANLPLRVRSICFPLTPNEPCETAPSDAPRGSKLTWGGLKWITDGTPLERNAFLREPYADAPDFFGIFNFSESALHTQLRRSLGHDRARDQPIFHAVGDAALDEVLDAASRFGARAWRGRRFRIEHGDLIYADHIARLRRLEAIVVQNPLHLGIPDLMHQRLGPARAEIMQPLRTLLRTGVGLAFGTDAIGAVQTPWLDLLLAITHPTNPSEALTLEQALTAYTRGAAFAEFTDDRKGTLAPGMLADFAVLSQDVFRVTPAQLPATRSVLTVIGGKVVWDAGALHR